MIRAKDIFHKISYLQYPVIIYSLYYYYLFISSILRNQIEWREFNNVLVFVGIALSLSTLQDTTKTQNTFSRKIWESPIKGKIALVVISLMTIAFLCIGLIAFLDSKENIQKEISFGLIVLGIGLIGLLKAAIEMFDNHRKDKNTVPENL
jgi:di/tricarboxylate transporter